MLLPSLRRGMRSTLLPRLLLASLLACAAWAADNTHFDNHSKTWTILATTSYPGGNSQFINRAIPPGGSDVDTYNYVDHVDVKVQVKDAPFFNHFTIQSDQSVVAEDTPGNQYGVDFWLNDGKGNPLKTGLFGLPTGPLVTIFGPGPPPTPSPTPTPTPAPPSTLEPLGDEDSCGDLENGYTTGASITAQEAPDHRIPAWEVSNTAIFPPIGLLFKSTKIIFSCAYGTAFAISRNHVLTAAHMLYIVDKKQSVIPDHIDFGKVGPKDKGTAGGYNIKVKKCMVPDSWKNPDTSDSDRPTYDFGVCLLSKALPDSVGYLNPVVPPANPNAISTAGYPLEAPWPPTYDATSARQKPFMTTETASIGENGISFNSQGSRGQSGSPFFAAQGTAGHPAQPASPSRPAAFGVVTARPDSQTQVIGLPFTQGRINIINGWLGNELKP